MPETALKEPDSQPSTAPQTYDELLHERFTLWKDHSGHSLTRIATMLARSTAAVSQYLSKKYQGNIAELEKDIASLLRREEELEFVTRPGAFCSTGAAKLIWEVLQYCDSRRRMGLVACPSGTGKTEVANEYKRRHRATILITLDITTRTAAQVVRRIAERTGGPARRCSRSDLLELCIQRLKGSRRLLIVDEAHFLAWDGMELIRKLHDCAQIGVAYLGQERWMDHKIKDQLAERLHDQITSRIAIQRTQFPIKAEDVALIARTMCPDIDKECLELLTRKARGKGRYRAMKNLLEMALELAGNDGGVLRPEHLHEAEQFLVQA